MTELSRWRLVIDAGRQVWEYMPNTSQHMQTFYEKYFLGLTPEQQEMERQTEHPNLHKVDSSNRGSTSARLIQLAIKFYSQLQTGDGHWANDYGGPLFLMPGLIITSYISGHKLKEEQVKEMIRYLKGQQKSDGGWGLHIESVTSTMFGTVTNYVALRILGVPKDVDWMQNAGDFIKKHGGAIGTPSWGKFWLASLGLYKWEGINSLLPELWLLPYFLPFHPGRFWCHCRVVYLPMSYIYGCKATMPENELIRSLRKEIYVEDYDKIDFSSHRFTCSTLDTYTKPSWLLRFLFGTLAIYEKIHWGWLRKKALAKVIDHIQYEDENTKYIDIGPVNKCINMLSIWWHYGSSSDRFKQHCERIPDYLWLAQDGMKMQGYNGSQLWDTAFSLQAIFESGHHKEFKDVLVRGHNYLEISQVREDAPNLAEYYRHISKGAWPFSTRDHGWPISDCTAEGLKAALHLKDLNYIDPLETTRYHDAVNVILSLQNSNGGWATYENQRGPAWVEALNPSEVFHNIMVDYSYVECSSASIQALCLFQKHFPNHRSSEIQRAINRGIKYIKSIQRPDGSWIGSWGVCFTYATWFGIEALNAVGENNSEEMKKACEFFISKQKPDGGWGETFQSCVKKEWDENETSQTVNTAWAILGLLRAQEPNRKVIELGIDNLISKQFANGDWKQEDISGVFNANCSISYSSYKNVFPIWALSRYRNTYHPDLAPK